MIGRIRRRNDWHFQHFRRATSYPTSLQRNAAVSTDRTTAMVTPIKAPTRCTNTIHTRTTQCYIWVRQGTKRVIVIHASTAFETRGR